jgi:uncharacterized protein YjbI with pentapeptide repeats
MGMRSQAPKLDLHGAFVRRINLSDASLQGANLSRADASGAVFRHADFKNAVLEGTVLNGADLTGAINLTEEQLAVAIIDDDTLLPGYIDRSKIRRLKSP